MMSADPLLQAFQRHRVTAYVKDVDRYKTHSGMVVETDYIICVASDGNHVGGDLFPPFTISKTFRAIRELSAHLKSVMKSHTKRMTPENERDPQVYRLITHIQKVTRLVGKQKTQYFGKVTYTHVKSVAKKRAQIINETLRAILDGFPTDISANPFFLDVTEAIELFFLTDYCEEATAGNAQNSNNVSLSSYLSSAVSAAMSMGQSSVSEATSSSNKRSSHRYTKSSDFHRISASLSLPDTPAQNKKNSSTLSPSGSPRAKIDAGSPRNHTSSSQIVQPYTRKNRRSVEIRDADQRELNQGRPDLQCWTINGEGSVEMTISDAPPPSWKPVVKKAFDIVEYIEMNRVIGVTTSAFFVFALWAASRAHLNLQFDTALLFLAAAFSMGRQWCLVVDHPSSTEEQLLIAQQRRRSSAEMRRVMLHSAGRNSAGSDDSSMHQLLRQSMATTPSKALQQRPCVRTSPAEEDISDHAVDLVIPPDRSIHISGDSVEIVVDDTISNRGDDDLLLPAADNEARIAPGLPSFPAGAKLGSHLNCWSMPDHTSFQVRGENYLQDRKKVSSEEFIFRARGTDLFLTDLCPEHAAMNPNIFGGKLRELPTFIINFRLPWGVLLAYYEIPSRLVPFLRARYEPEFDSANLPAMGSLTPGDRCVANFLMGTDEHRNQVLKIVPMVVAGPWVVKAAAGGKPAILGSKMPVRYFYGRGNPKRGHQPYLETDLDIVASSAARGILSVARKYTQLLSIDLGFVIEGKTPQELPERMLSGTRLHGIDPLSAPVYPADDDPSDDEDGEEEDVSNECEDEQEV